MNYNMTRNIIRQLSKKKFKKNNTITNPWSGKKIKSTNNSKSMNNRNILDLVIKNYFEDIGKIK